jgi:hypothetical protein
MFDQAYWNNLRSLTQDMNAFNNFCQAYERMIQMKNHDNYVLCINKAHAFLSQYIVRGADIDLISFDKTPGYWDAIIPESLSQFCIDNSATLGYDRFSSLMGCLGIISVALNGKYFVDLGENWIEPIVLYQLFIAPSGSRKSSFIDLHKEPLREMLKNLQYAFDNDSSLNPALAKDKIKALKQSQNMSIKVLQKNCRFPSGNPDYNSLLAGIEKINDGLEPYLKALNNILERIRPELFVEYSTERGMLFKLAQYGCLAIVDPESNLVHTLNKGSGNEMITNLLLKAYGDSMFTYDKYNQSTVIENPRLNIMAGTQPATVSGFFSSKRNIDTGLIGRFIPIFVTLNYNYRNDNYEREQINEKFNKANFSTFLQRILIQSLRMNKATGIPITESARKLALNFRSANECLSSVNKHMSSFLHKLHGLACRIAGILSLIDPYNHNYCVDERHMQQAIQIANELVPHEDFATNPCGLMSIEASKKIEGWYCGYNRVIFDYREAKQALNSKYDRETVQSALKLLCYKFHIVSIPGLKKTETYVVHPGIVNPCHLPQEYQYTYCSLIQQQFLLPPLKHNLLLPGYDDKTIGYTNL